MAEDLKNIEISAIQFDNITTDDGVPVNFTLKGTEGIIPSLEINSTIYNTETDITTTTTSSSDLNEMKFTQNNFSTDNNFDKSTNFLQIKDKNDNLINYSLIETQNQCGVPLNNADGSLNLYTINDTGIVYGIKGWKESDDKPNITKLWKINQMPSFSWYVADFIEITSEYNAVAGAIVSEQNITIHPGDIIEYNVNLTLPAYATYEHSDFIGKFAYFINNDFRNPIAGLTNLVFPVHIVNDDDPEFTICFNNVWKPTRQEISTNTSFNLGFAMNSSSPVKIRHPGIEGFGDAMSGMVKIWRKYNA